MAVAVPYIAAAAAVAVAGKYQADRTAKATGDASDAQIAMQEQQIQKEEAKQEEQIKKTEKAAELSKKKVTQKTRSSKFFGRKGTILTSPTPASEIGGGVSDTKQQGTKTLLGA